VRIDTGTIARSGGAVDGRPAPVLQAVDDVHLPQRPGAIQRPADDPAYLFGQLVDQTRSGEMQLPDVEVEVEGRVEYPVRVVELEWHPDEAPPQRLELTDERGVLGVHRRIGVVVGAGPFEDHQAGDMPERRRCLHVEECGV
jgi:hypothetical protein